MLCKKFFYHYRLPRLTTEAIVILSKYTFTTALSDESNKSLVVGNYLSGSMDILDPDEAKEFQEARLSKSWSDCLHTDYLKERGYLFSSEQEEQSLIQEKYFQFSEEYEKTGMQIIFAPSFACNLACTYCYQEEYQNKESSLKREIVDAFFNYIGREFSSEPQKPYITLFGGEPLLKGREYKEGFIYFLQKAKELDYEVAIVTNGYELFHYIPEFLSLELKIREIQVTLDGNQDIHDSRRPTHSGKGTFLQIVEGIESALKHGYRINLRAIIDKENLVSLVDLANFCKERGWLNYPSDYFETSIGRNYELHTCQPNSSLFTRAQMWQEYVKLASQYPVLKEFHKPQFHGIRTLFETSQLPEPAFDTCPAGKKEWAFDASGGIYACTASVGIEKYKLGSYLDPTSIVDQESIEKLKNRDVLSMEECKSCAVSLSCGGGCAIVACNKTDNLLAPDCRPVADLVSLGLEYYNLTETVNQ